MTACAFTTDRVATPLIQAALHVVPVSASSPSYMERLSEPASCVRLLLRDNGIAMPVLAVSLILWH